MTLTTKHIPNEPWVYLFKSKSDKILYIGKAKNLQKRVQQYFTPGSVWKQEMVVKAHKIDFITVTNESESLYLEDNLIKQHKPPYNSLLKWDNTYIFVKITNEAYPQVLFTRKRIADGSIYIGPKRSSRTLKNVLRYIRRYLQYRWCKNTQFRQWKLCSDYFWWLCKWWCVFAQLKNKTEEKSFFDEAKKLWLIIDADYEWYTAQYKVLMQLLAKTIDGNPTQLLEKVTQDIQHCIETENFERAGQLKEVYQWLHQYYEKQSVVLEESISAKITKISQVADWYVVIMLHFNEWRIIDVIRTKIHKNETDVHELLVLSEQEIGEEIVIKYKSKTVWKRVSDTESYHTTSMIQEIEKKLPFGIVLYPENTSHIHKNLWEIDTIAQTALDSFIISSSFEEENIMTGILEGLQQKFFLKEFPYHVECLDISHFGWKQTSGWLSCIQGWLPHKYGYRRYKIQSTDTGDDYQALREVVIRRFKLTKGNKKVEDTSVYPQLFILDGGKAQLWIIPELIKEYPMLSAIMQKTQFASLEKWKARKRSNKKNISEMLHVLLDDWSVVSKPFTYDKIDQMLVKLRDEAHRFANMYRKKQASKEWKN